MHTRQRRLLGPSAVLLSVALNVGCHDGRAIETGDDAATESVPSEDPGPDFDPVPDIGDGTLDDEMLAIVQTGSGPLYLWMLAQRKGDTFQAWLRSTELSSDWFPVGVEGFSNALVIQNAFTVPYEGFEFVAGAHPFGAEAVTVDLVFDLALYEDELLCGTLDIDFPGGTDLQGLPVVMRPIDELGAAPDPATTCTP